MTTLDQTITEQIGDLALLMLGAEDLAPTGDDNGLCLTINTPGRTPEGERETRPRRMDTTVILDINDTYTLTITYTRESETVTHLLITEIYDEQLPEVFTRIDRGTLHGIRCGL